MNRIRSDSRKSFEISAIWRIMFQIPVEKSGVGGLCVCVGGGYAHIESVILKKNILFLCGI